MANLKNTEIDNNLELPSGTTAERPSSPQEGQIRYNTDLGVTEFYNGSNWRPLSDTHAEATGGTVVDTDIGGVPYRIHYFTETGTDTLTVTNPGEVEYLIVAGGGGGGRHHGGGGGAGGVLTGITSVTAQTYTVTVGAGGTATSGTNSVPNGRGGDGGDSSAVGLIAFGGGGGGNYEIGDGGDGGSGGGAQNWGSGRSGGTGVSGQGNDGSSNNGTNNFGGGGGGAGGSSPNNRNNLNDGGPGISSNIVGSVVFYGGGGAAGTYPGTSRYTGENNGGVGGGGAGGIGPHNSGTNGTAGLTNTGGGGGGAATYTSLGGNGGSGIVIIRYPRNSSFDSEPDRTVIATQPNRFQTVRDGLILELDAANPLSYSGSGSNLLDIASSNTFTIEGANFVAPNYFNFDGSNDRIGNSSFFLNSDPLVSVVMWIRRTDNLSVGGYWGLGGGAANNGINGHAYPGRSNKIGWDLWGRTTFDTGQDYPFNQWVNIVWVKFGTTFTTSTLTVYINGVEFPLVFTSRNNSSSVNLNTGFAIGNMSANLTGYYAPGDIGQTLVYNRALSAEEITQNFNATRGRYGI